jgi:hypothetical protein
MFYPIMLGTTKDDPLKSRMMFGFGRTLVNMFIRGFINKQRAKFALAPIRDVWAHWLGENAIDISQRLQNVNGVELTVQLIEKEFRK